MPPDNIVPEKKKKSTWQNKMRLVVLNDDSLEEIVSYRLTRMNIYLLVSSIFVLIIILVTLIIFYTPIRQYVPGYGDYNMRRELLAMQAALDSMQRQMSAQEQYFASKAVALNDELAKNETASKYKKGFNKDSAQSNKIPYSVGNIKPVGDTLKQILQEASSGGGKLTDLRLSNLSGATESGNMNFGSPLTSTAIMNNPFEPGKGHYGIDIADKEGTPIKAVLGGTVILSTWSYESGFMIAVQHHNNFVSFYKHCSMLLKKVGDYVNAGEVLAIIGNTGTHSSGPHLHFELWHNAHPIDPKLYIKF